MTKPRSKILILALIGGYILLFAVYVWGMFLTRQNVISQLSTEQSQADWNTWRAEAAQQDGTHGPVQRVAPKSPEPPLLILMRDYFPTCIVCLGIPLTALYGVITWMAYGVARQKTTTAPDRDNN